MNDEGKMFSEKKKHYVWGTVEAHSGTNDIYFGQLIGKAVGDYNGDLNVTGMWWGILQSSANPAQQQNQRHLSLI